MAETIERGVASRRQERAVVGTDATAETEFARRLAAHERRRTASATWSTSLAPQDLACLMAVIETQLLPTLLRSYRPADRTPLNRSGLA